MSGKRAILYMSALSICMLCGCKKTPAKTDEIFTGGDIVRFNIAVSDSALVTCPLITNVEIETIELLGADFSDAADLDVAMREFSGEPSFTYEGYFVYCILMDIINNSSGTAADTSISTIHYLINGEPVDYAVSDFQVINIEGLCENYQAQKSDGTLLISSDVTGIFGYLPTAQRPYNVALEPSKEITVESFSTLGDCLSMEEFKVDGVRTDSDHIQKELGAGEEISFSCGFCYQNGADESNIIRDSYVILYTCDGKRYIFEYPSGVYIWNNFDELGNEQTIGAIKKYIDTSLKQQS